MKNIKGKFLSLVIIIVLTSTLFTMYVLFGKTSKSDFVANNQPLPSVKPSDLPDSTLVGDIPSCFLNKTMCDPDGCTSCDGIPSSDVACSTPGDHYQFNSVEIKPDDTGSYCIPNKFIHNTCNSYTGKYVWGDTGGVQGWECQCKYPGLFNDPETGCTTPVACINNQYERTIAEQQKDGNKLVDIVSIVDGSEKLTYWDPLSSNIEDVLSQNPYSKLKMTDDEINTACSQLDDEGKANCVAFLEESINNGSPRFVCGCGITKDNISVPYVKLPGDFYNCHIDPCHKLQGNANAGLFLDKSSSYTNKLIPGCADGECSCNGIEAECRQKNKGRTYCQKENNIGAECTISDTATPSCEADCPPSGICAATHKTCSDVKSCDDGETCKEVNCESIKDETACNSDYCEWQTNVCINGGELLKIGTEKGLCFNSTTSCKEVSKVPNYDFYDNSTGSCTITDDASVGISRMCISDNVSFDDINKRKDILPSNQQYTLSECYTQCTDENDKNSVLCIACSTDKVASLQKCNDDNDCISSNCIIPPDKDTGYCSCLDPENLVGAEVVSKCDPSPCLHDTLCIEPTDTFGQATCDCGKKANGEGKESCNVTKDSKTGEWKPSNGCMIYNGGRDCDTINGKEGNIIYGSWGNPGEGDKGVCDTFIAAPNTVIGWKQYDCTIFGAAGSIKDPTKICDISYNPEANMYANGVQLADEIAEISYLFDDYTDNGKQYLEGSKGGISCQNKPSVRTSGPNKGWNDYEKDPEGSIRDWDGDGSCGTHWGWHYDHDRAYAWTC